MTHDGSLVLLDKEKAQRMNSYSTEIGKNLINSLPMPRQHAPVDGNTIFSLIYLLTNQSVQDKVNKPKPTSRADDPTTSRQNFSN